MLLSNSKKIALIVTLIASIGIGGYFYWKSTPSYTLYSIAKAFKDHDRELFEEFVDIESLSSNLVDQLMNVPEKQSNNKWEEMGHAMGMGMLKMMKPQLTNVVKDQIISFIEADNFETKNTKEANKEENVVESFRFIKERNLEYRGVSFVKKEGKIAQVGFKISNDFGEEIETVVRMRKKSSTWQLIDIANIMELAKNYKLLTLSKLGKILPKPLPTIQEYIGDRKPEDIRMGFIEKYYNSVSNKDSIEEFFSNSEKECEKNTDYKCRFAAYGFKFKNNTKKHEEYLVKACFTGGDLVSCSGIVAQLRDNDPLSIKAKDILVKKCSERDTLGCSLVSNPQLYKNTAEGLKEALVYLNKSCEIGNSDGCILGRLTEIELGDKGAITKIKEICDKGNYGACLTYNSVTKKDEDIPISTLHNGCKIDLGNACFELGNAFYKKGDLLKSADVFSESCNNLSAVNCSAMGYLLRENNFNTNANAFFQRSCDLGISKDCKNAKERNTANEK